MTRYSLWPFAALLTIVSSALRVSGVSQAQTENAGPRIALESVANDLKFNQTEIRARSGETVNLVFVNGASVQEILRNVVILQDEESIDRVGQAEISGAETELVPYDDAILFHTPLASPVDTVDVTFSAPEPGTNYCACTYLGHYGLMRGVFIVTKLVGHIRIQDTEPS